MRFRREATGALRGGRESRGEEVMIEPQSLRWMRWVIEVEGNERLFFYRLILTSSSALHDASSVFCYAKSTFSRWRRQINAKLLGVYPNVLFILASAGRRLASSHTLLPRAPPLFPPPGRGLVLPFFLDTN